MADAETHQGYTLAFHLGHRPARRGNGWVGGARHRAVDRDVASDANPIATLDGVNHKALAPPHVEADQRRLGAARSRLGVGGPIRSGCADLHRHVGVADTPFSIAAEATMRE